MRTEYEERKLQELFNEREGYENYLLSLPSTSPFYVESFSDDERWREIDAKIMAMTWSGTQSYRDGDPDTEENNIMLKKLNAGLSNNDIVLMAKECGCFSCEGALENVIKAHDLWKPNRRERKFYLGYLRSVVTSETVDHSSF